MQVNVMHSVVTIKQKKPKIVETVLKMYENVQEVAEMEFQNHEKNVIMVVQKIDMTENVAKNVKLQILNIIAEIKLKMKTNNVMPEQKMAHHEIFVQKNVQL